jgi:phospholipid/cholesterol/gamma-HCH transport system permease protein
MATAVSITPATAPSYQLSKRQEGDSLHLSLRGRVDVTHSQNLLDDLIAAAGQGIRRVTLDLGDVDYFDSGGGAVVVGFRQYLASRDAELTVGTTTPEIKGLLGLIDEDALQSAPARKSPSAKPLATRIGEGTLNVLADARQLIAFTGEVIIGLRGALAHPGQIRWRETWQYMQRAGVDGLPIVSLISFLMGLITAFQASVQLTQFGADIYVANLVGLSIVRELGPLMTAIIAAGRSGAAFAAEIGTMKVSEEIDALTTMGLDRTRFLVTPKVFALLVMLPCLTLYADFVGIIGGMTVGVAGLGLPVQVYVRQTAAAMAFWDIASGLVKSVAFALLISGVGCLRGFQASTGAESVGRITTSAIVAGIFLIIVADAIFTIVFHYF